MPSICVTIPMKAIKVEKGSFTFEVTADDRHLNPMGGVHGGFAATVLDSATGCAVHSTLEAGLGFGTIDLNIKMVRPVPKNVTLIAVATVGFTWHPSTKEIWFTDNGRDLMGNEIPNCELNHAPKDGMHFGYPYCHQGDISDPEFGEKHACSEFTPPIVKLGAH